MKEIPEFLRQEYTLTAAVAEAMNHLRMVWTGIRPKPPITRSDLFLLSAIKRFSAEEGKKITVGSLARGMHQSPPGISQKVSMLEDAGYLRRRADKADRRVVCIEITPKGNQVVSQSMKEFAGRMEEALQKMGSEKTDTLLSLMQELSEHLEGVKKEEQ